MHLLFSPWFVGLSILSVCVTVLQLLAFLRSRERWKNSVAGMLCNESNARPSIGMWALITFYLLMTLVYVVIPPLLHDVFL